MISRRGISLAIASLAAAGAIAVPAFALASGGGSASTTLAEPVVVQQVEGGTETEEKAGCRSRGEHRGQRGAALAEALGIDVEVLRSAAEVARESLGDRPDEITPELREARRAAFVSALAVELGVSEAEITDALEALRADRLVGLADKLAEAVENGRITQDEADDILESIENGERPEGFRGRFHRGGGHHGGDTTEPVGQSA